MICIFAHGTEAGKLSVRIVRVQVHSSRKGLVFITTLHMTVHNTCGKKINGGKFLPSSHKSSRSRSRSRSHARPPLLATMYVCTILRS